MPSVLELALANLAERIGGGVQVARGPGDTPRLVTARMTTTTPPPPAQPAER